MKKIAQNKKILAFYILILFLLLQMDASAFDFGRFTFKWDRPQGVDQVVFQVDYIDTNGKTGNYETTLPANQTEITDDLAAGWTYEIKLIPVKGGTRGEAWVTYIVMPGAKVASQAIKF